MYVKLKDSLLFAQLILISYLIISTIVVCFVGKTTMIVNYTQILLFVVFFWTVAAQIKLNGLMHLFSIFLFLFFLFLLGTPFFDMLKIINIDNECLFVPVKLSNAIYIKVYTYTSLFLAVMFLGVLFGHKSENDIKKTEEVNYSHYLFSGGVLIFLLGLPGVLLKYYIQLQVIIEKGYLALHDGTLQQLQYPLICRGAGTLLIIGYCIFISSKPNKKQFLIITSIFLLTQVLNVLKGQRATLMFPLVFSLWFYFKFYLKNVSTVKLIIMVLCLIIFSQFIMIFRSGKRYEESTKDKPFVEKYVSEFWVQQGVSFFVFPYMLHYDIKNEKYPYLLAPLDVRSYAEPQGMERLEKSNYLPDKLMYRMLPESFKDGLGVGSSIVGEFYDLPHLIAIFLCFLFGFLIAQFEFFLKKSRILLLFSYYIVVSTLASPRFELFQLFYDAVILSIAFVFIKSLPIIIHITNSKNEKNTVHKSFQ